MVKNHVEDSGLWDITRSCSCQDECRMTSICDPVLAQQTCFLAVFWINFADNSRWVPCFPLPFGPTIEEKPHCQGGRVKSGFLRKNILFKQTFYENDPSNLIETKTNTCLSLSGLQNAAVFFLSLVLSSKLLWKGPITCAGYQNMHACFNMNKF